MDVSDLLRHCLWCGEAYLRTVSKPVWCFDEELKLAGSVHTSHAAAWRKHMTFPNWLACFGGDPEVARRYTWAKQEVEPQEYYFGLVSHFAEPAERERHISYWLSSGYLDENAAEALAERSRQLEFRYLEKFPEPLALSG